MASGKRSKSDGGVLNKIAAFIVDSKANQFRLFQKVALMEPKVMMKKDLDFLKSF